jgi:hypothetical protein
MRVHVRFLLLSCALAALAGASEGRAQSPAGDPLIVHEWGTFTSMQGSDGACLEGLHHEEEALPGFVYSRAKVRECPLRKQGYKGLEVPAEHVTQKMETPVIYFHSARERRVRVRVDFTGGLLTQWYPVTNLLGPPEGAKTDGPLDVAKVSRSFLEWDLKVRARGAAPAVSPPYAHPEDPWILARATGACFVETMPRVDKDRSGPVEAERYLFYRGLGTFGLPLRAITKGDGTAVENTGDAQIRRVIALRVRAAGAAYQDVGEIEGKGGRPVFFAKVPLAPLDGVVRELSAVVCGSLEKEGLYDDEARAMVATWARQWFRTPGDRLIYLVPRAVTDAMLPLAIQPAPDELVRVLVGRLELITPEKEAEVERALLARVGDDAAARAAAAKELAALDRFLEPHVRRVLAITSDQRVRRSAEELLQTLK